MLVFRGVTTNQQVLNILFIDKLALEGHDAMGNITQQQATQKQI